MASGGTCTSLLIVYSGGKTITVEQPITPTLRERESLFVSTPLDNREDVVDVDQSYINAAIGIVGAGIGWVLRVIWAEIKDLQKTDDQLFAKVSKLEVFVASQYPTREELRHEFDEVNQMLRAIDQKLDRKADK